MKFRVTRNYQSGRAGPWREGDVINLDDNELIAWLSRDAPGLLEPYVEEKRTLDQPPQDRMVRGGKKRSKKDE